MSGCDRHRGRRAIVCRARQEDNRRHAEGRLDRQDPLPLPHREAPRGGRHGRGLPRPRSRAGQGRGGQGAGVRRSRTRRARASSARPQACARLQHPAIATFFESGESEGVAFLAMEFVAGETLRDRLRRGRAAVSAGAVGDRVAARGARPRARGGRPASGHQAGEHHDHRRPPRKAARLRDRAAARTRNGVGSEEKTEVALTEAGAVIGTLGYMSPEQLRGKPLDERSDLFSLGAVFYEAIAGRPAFPGDNPAERIAANLSAEFAPLGAAGVPARGGRRAGSRDGPRSRAPIPVRRGVSRGPARAGLGRARWPRCRTRSRSSTFAISRAIPTTTGSAAASPRAWPSTSSRLAGCLARAAGRSAPGRRGSGGAGAAARTGPRLPLGPLGCLPARGAASAGDVAAVRRHHRRRRRFGEGRRRRSTRCSRCRTGSRPRQRSGCGPAARRPSSAPRRGSTSTSVTSGGAVSSTASRRARSTRRRRSSSRPWPPTAPTRRPWPVWWPCTACAFRIRPTRASSRSPRATRVGRSPPTPTLAEPRIWLGYALARTGRTEEASEQERRAMELDPSSVYAPYFGGIWLAQATRADEALALFQRTVGLDPRHGFAWLALGWTHLDLAHGAEARWCLEKAVALEGQTGKGPTSGVACYLGEACDAWGISIGRGRGASRGSRPWSARTSCTATRFAASASAPSAARPWRSATAPPRTPPSRRPSRTCAAGRAASAAGTCSSRPWPGSRARVGRCAVRGSALPLAFARRARFLVHVGLHRRRDAARALARGGGARKVRRRGGPSREGAAAPASGAARGARLD